ncbi:MAG: 4Fe-4S dicluster domain-containing protein [Candidatus Hodarchaeales archaeon]
MEGWGFPKRNPETCIGCYTCYNTCPEGVITIEDVDNKRIFGSLNHNCIHCKKCEETCPTEALTVISGFELLSFLKNIPREDISHELLACSECGKNIAPIRHLKHVEQMVDASRVKQVMNIPEGHLHVCSDCKRKQIASGLLKTSEGLTALFTSRRS